MLTMVRSLSIKSKLLVLVGTFVLGLVVFGYVSRATLNLAKVNGPLYQQIVRDKDLLADVMPPPAFLLETYLVAHQMCRVNDARDAEQLIERYNALKEEYCARLAVWQSSVLQPATRKVLFDESRPPADAFFEVMEQKLIPAIQRNDLPEANTVLTSLLTPQYDEHRDAIDNLVMRTSQGVSAYESTVANLISYRTSFLFGTGIAVVIIGCALAFYIIRSILNQIRMVIETLKSVAEGDLSRRMDSGDKTEFGSLSVVVNEMITSLEESEKNLDAAGQIAAIRKSQSVIEFSVDGTILDANEILLNTTGYRLDEVKGQHHRMFVEPSERNSTEYAQFWRDLRDGKSQSAEYKRIGKGNKEVWIHATYNPINDANGKPFKIVKFASEITTQKLKSADYEGQIAAISRSHAVVELTLDGVVQSANQNFLKLLGYEHDEIKGRHHDQFVEESYRKSDRYREFFYNLRKGDFQAGTFKLLSLQGQIVWVEASYNPILNTNGKVFKIVVYASDVTEIVKFKSEASRLTSMVEQAPTNILFADRELRISYMNAASAKSLKSLERMLPVSIDNMIGQSIDVFHSQPAKQRMLLSDPKNFPYRTRVQLGPETLDALISTVYDDDQKFIGAMFTWEMITEKLSLEVREKEITARIQSVLSRVAQNSSAMAAASEQLSAVSVEMSASAEETSAQSGVVSVASEHVSRNTRTVAAGIQEMSASIKDIAKNASDASRVANSAVKFAQTTNATITKLGESSAEINNVIKVITTIAHQTNLLALNATIEASRAGDSGKGFAVVANEVKELAKETAIATDEISQKIEAIQNDTKGAIAAINQISGVINEISQISNLIAIAIEEQRATTNEISQNISEASQGTSDIAENITSVAQAARVTTQGALNSQCAAQELARMAAELQQMVSEFNSNDNASSAKAKSANARN